MGQCFLYNSIARGKDRLNFRLFAGPNPPSNPKPNDVFVRTTVLPVNEWQLRGEGHPLPWLEKENDIVIQTSSIPGSPVFVDIFLPNNGDEFMKHFSHASSKFPASGLNVKRISGTTAAGNNSPGPKTASSSTTATSTLT